MSVIYNGEYYKDYDDLIIKSITKYNTGEIDKHSCDVIVNMASSEIEKQEKLTLIEYWKNLDKKFIRPKDVPKLNLYDEDYQLYIIPSLIRNGAIRKSSLIEDNFYHGSSKFGKFGKWDLENNKFKVWRKKFGIWRICEMIHFEDSVDNTSDLFIPLTTISEESYMKRKISK